MESSSLNLVDTPSVRNLELLVGSSFLPSVNDPSTDDLASLGPVMSSLETNGEEDPAADDPSGLPGAVTGPANGAVLEAHAQFEETGHDVAPLNGPLHGLTNLGETAGPGHLGEPGNLVTDAAAAALAPGDTAAGTRVVDDSGAVVGAAGALAETAAAVPAAGNGVVGSGGLSEPAAGLLNAEVLSIHGQLEETGHQNPTLNGPVHGLTGLGETLGMGYIGTPGTVITDATNLPGALLGGGGVGTVAPVLHDLGAAATAADTLIDSVFGAPNATGGLLASGGLLEPVATLADATVLDTHAGLEGLGHDVPTLNEPLHGLTSLGETIGLGHLGEPGYSLTDVVNAPGALLDGGGTGTVTPILSDLGHVVEATGGLVGGVTGAVSGAAAGGGLPGTGGPLDSGGLLEPVATLADATVLDTHAGLEGLGHDVPTLNEPLHGLTSLGETIGLGHLDEPGHILTDATNLPGSLLDGGGTGAVTPVLSDLGHVVGATGGLVGGLTGAASGAATGGDLPGADGLLAPAASGVGAVIGSTGGAASGTGGLTGAATGLVGGVLGTGGDAHQGGDHSLVNASVGPATTAPVANVGVLASPADNPHAVEANAVSVGPSQPTLASANLLDHDGIEIPNGDGHGADALVGALAGAPGAAASALPSGGDHTSSTPTANVDAHVVSVDVGSHATSHEASPTPHAAPLGIHLL